MFWKNWKCLVTVAALVGMGTLALPGAAHGQSGTWNQTASGGNWGTAANWAGNIVANGSGNTADFSALDIPADNTVHLDTSRTIGNLTFGDTNTATAAGWILDNNSNAANILTLAGGAPTITVNGLAPDTVFAPKSALLSGVIAGSSGLTKAGVGRLKLTGSNTYTGGTVVDGGTLAIRNNNNLGAVPGSFDAANITLNNGATLDATANTDNNNDGNTVDLHANRGITLGPGMQTLRKNHRGITFNIRGVISGPGGVDFNEPTTGDDGGGSRTHLYGANTYMGDTTITHSGIKDPGLFLRNALALQNSTLDYFVTGSNTTLLWFQSNIGTSTGFTLGGLKGTKNLNLSPQGNTARDLKIGNNGQDTTFDAVISSSNDALAGITKIGTGTLTLTKANTYTGPTTITSGTLELSSTGSLAAGSAVAVNGGALAGDGTVNGPITVAAGGGVIAPGSSIGTLHGSSVTWNSDDTLPGMAFDLSTTDNTSDLLDLSGAFTKGAGSDFLFDFTGGLVGQTYTLVEFGNTNFSAGDFGVNSGISGTFAFEGNTLQFNSTAADAIIPEPSTLLVWALLGLLGLGLGRRRRGR